MHSCTIVLFKSSFQTNHFHGNHFFFWLRTELSHISIRGRQQEDTSFISCCSKTRLLCAHLVAKQDMMRAARAHTSLDLRAVAAGSPPSRGQKNKKQKKIPYWNCWDQGVCTNTSKRIRHVVSPIPLEYVLLCGLGPLIIDLNKPGLPMDNLARFGWARAHSHRKVCKDQKVALFRQDTEEIHREND